MAINGDECVGGGETPFASGAAGQTRYWRFRRRLAGGNHPNLNGMGRHDTRRPPSTTVF